MRKRSLLALALSSTAIRVRNGVKSQEFHGHAALLNNTSDIDDYAVLDCTQVDGAKCIGQCAEVWCGSDSSENCVLGSRPIVRVADKCVTCKHGDLTLPRNILQELSGSNANVDWIPVRWRCVDCGRRYDSDVQDVDETMRPESDSRTRAPLSFDIITDQATHQPIECGTLHSFTSSEHFSGILDAQVEMPLLENHDSSKGNSASDNRNSDAVLSCFGSTMEEGRKTSMSKLSSEPSAAIPSRLSTLSSGRNVSPSTPSVSRANLFPSGSSTLDLSGASGSPISSPVVNQDSSYGLETVNSKNARARFASPSQSGTARNTNQRLPPTKVSPSQVSDSSGDNSDYTLSATSAVTKSPFFYASIMLGIVGVLGSVIGYQAKQKRSYRNKRRALQTSAQRNTCSFNSRSTSPPIAILASRTHPGSHSIVIL